jgi:2,3-bisphosphoglycerate-independent phosphoglycerate mutase
VPFFLVGARNRMLVKEGRLADIAPTLLELMDLPKPQEMTGASLLRGNEGAAR